MKKKNKDEKVSESFHAWWGMLEARAKPHPMSAHEGLSLGDAPGSSLHSLSLSLSLSLALSLSVSTSVILFQILMPLKFLQRSWMK